MCVHTNTAVQVNGQPRRALAAERTLRVQTAAIHADTCCLALIDVDTVASVWSQGEAGFTDALEAAVLVDAHAIQTHVGGRTFIMIYTVFSIRTNLKASIAYALEASFCVHTAAVAAHDSVYDTLVNINAGLLGGGALIPLVALAVVRTRGVNAVSVHTGVTATLVHICALARPLLTVAHVTLAAVAVRGGDATAVQTQIGEMLTHIDGCAYVLRQDNNWTGVNLGPLSSIAIAIAISIAVSMPILSRILVTIKHVNSLSTGCEGNSLHAQPPIFIGTPYWTNLWDVTHGPAAACITAALHLGILACHFHRAAPVSKGRKTHTQSLIYTSGPICTGDKAARTGADVAASSVGAFSTVTNTRGGGAFIHIFTLLVGLTLPMACRTFTLV